MIKKEQVLQSIKDAEEAHKISTKTTNALNDVLAQIMSKLIMPGLIINLRFEKGGDIKPWLLWTKTIRGNDRGTKLFRIETYPRIDSKAGQFDLATWECEATPISETSKLPMSGRSHGADGNRETVKLTSNIFIQSLSENLSYSEYQHQKLMELIDYANGSVTNIKKIK